PDLTDAKPGSWLNSLNEIRRERDRLRKREAVLVEALTDIRDGHFEDLAIDWETFSRELRSIARKALADKKG
ncbi:MAG: hypothetical protein ACR2RE_00850, partial [Geminicoccaceae bacterium]